MTTEKRQNPRRFTPTIDAIYENAGGGTYRCEGPAKLESCSAWMQNTASGWTLLAHGITRYEDGTIEWDYSTDGGFNEGRLEEYRKQTERRKDAQTAQIWHRQMSLANAMLCFMI